MDRKFYLLIAILSATALIAGCTSIPGITITPSLTPVPATATVAPIPPPSFTLGNHYLQNTYTFNSQRNAYSEQLRIDSPSWGLEFNITPLSDNPQNSWFEITITNLDTNQNQTYGYGNADDGRTYPYDTYQRYPMYISGSYQFDMKGKLVGVNVNIAKRLP
jgi:hypothetical protein